MEAERYEMYTCRRAGQCMHGGGARQAAFQPRLPLLIGHPIPLSPFKNFTTSSTMSGIEVAGLVFGVLPVIAEVIKSYSSIISSLHTFRHYSGELKSVALKFKVQRAIFFNEVRHILGLVQDDKEIERMLEDQTHPRWANKELDDRLSAILRNSLDLCHSIIKDTSDSIEGMKEEMAKFEVLLQMKSQVRVVILLN